jgi:hypothetical protein
LSIIRFNFDETDKFAVLCDKEPDHKNRHIVMQYRTLFAAALAALMTSAFGACNKSTATPEIPAPAGTDISLQEVAALLASVPLETAQMEEVHDAASASALNGYDEEYRMKDLFAAPGTGVGADAPAKAGSYPRPLRELLREALLGGATKAGGPADSEAWLDALALSDVQIYWPYSDRWDGSSLPVVTYNPGEGATRNEGFALQPDGTLKKVTVDENTTLEQPVWVVNRNEDAQYKTLELLRREDPSWGSGGEILVKSTVDAGGKTLILRSFTAHRQFDSWFAGASEFFVKLGAVEKFKASTEAEMRLYDPSITDFMVVVRRSQKEKEIPFNAVLVSEWTKQLTSCGLMIIEDDGGTRTNWKCSAMVKVNSKSYGIELDMPLYSRDDIVWRGSLTRAFFERNSGEPVRLGDATLTFELI